MELRRANEYAAQPLEAVVRPPVQNRGEGIHLGAVGVAFGGDIEYAEYRHGVIFHLSRQQDRASASAEYRQSLFHPLR